MYENIVMVSHHFPGITPLNVMDMQYGMWVLYVDAIKELRDKEIGW